MAAPPFSFRAQLRNVCYTLKINSGTHTHIEWKKEIECGENKHTDPLQTKLQIEVYVCCMRFPFTTIKL